MKKIKILIGPSTFGYPDSSPMDKFIKNGFEVVKNPHGRKLAADELRSLLSGVDGIVAGLERLDRSTLEASGLKVISRCGAGLSNVDMQAAKDLGIKVFYTPDAPTGAVSELTLGAMIFLIRHAAQMDSDMHNGRWNKRVGLQLDGSTVAIIGFGRIGRSVAKLLKPFNAKIIAVDPGHSGEVDGIPVLSLEEALPQSDIITLHSSGDHTIFGQGEFRLMKEGVFLLNCARGGVIDEEQLMRAIDIGKVAGAWLDCFSEEPYRGPLMKYPQILMTPHTGSYTAECRKRMEMEAANNIINYFGGK